MIDPEVRAESGHSWNLRMFQAEYHSDPMGTSPSTVYTTTTPHPLSTTKYGPFSDKFMFKYLSRLLSSITPLPASTMEFPNTTMISRTYQHQFSDAELYDFLENEHKSSNSLDSIILQEAFSSHPTSIPFSIFEPSMNISELSDWYLSNSTLENCTDESYYDYPLPLPHTLAIILAGTLLSIVTAGGNVMVMAAFKLERQLQTISNYFLFSLAVADLTIGLISIPLMTFYTAKGGWNLGYTTCQFWLSIDYLMSNASVMNLLLISFDRYFSVTRPLTYRPRRTSKKAMIMIFSTFLISLLLWPPLIIAWPHIEGEFKIDDNECIVQFLRTNPAVTLGTATAAFYGPVVIMIILYSRVYYVTRTRQRELFKLQAFHQQSIRRTISSNSDARIPLRSTLSTTSSVVLGQKVSSYSKIFQRESSCPAASENETDLTTMFYNSSPNNSNSRSSPGGGRPLSRNLLQRVESEGKPWGFQALLDHFTRPKPIRSTPSSTRQASLASSGFEDEESVSAISADTTTYAPVGGLEEVLPLRRGIQRGNQLVHGACSPSPSDYGSTLANQFINHVRQSFMIRRKSKIELTRNPTIVPTKRSRSMSTPHAKQFKITKVASMLAHPHRYYQQQQQQHHLETLHQEMLQNNNSTNSYDPENSPIQELRRMSAVARISAKCAGVTKSAPTPSQVRRLNATSEEDENELAASGVSSLTDTPTRSASTPAGVQQASVYTVLIQLGKSAASDRTPPPPAPPPPQIEVHNGKRKISRHRPIITLYNSVGDYATLSPDRATSTISSFSTADISSAGVPSVVVRRLSSASSAVSDPLSPAHASTPLITPNRKCSHSSGLPSPSPSTGIRRTGVNRMSSGRSVGTNSTTNASLIATNQNSATVAPARSCRRRKRGERRQQESKAARTLSAILLAFVITWAPYNFIVCIESFHANSVPVFWFTLSYYLCYLNSTINPFLYALCNATFRRTFWRIMTLKWTPLKGHHHHHRPPHHQAAVALTAMAIAATSRQQPSGTSSSMKR